MRRLRRLLLLPLAVVPGVAAVAHGCSTNPPFESVCGWLAEPNNCLRQFHQDMLATASPTSTDNPNGDCTTYPAGSTPPTEASPGAPGITNGSFVMRAMLDMCIIDTGGSVTFSPAIDLTMFPPSIFADPITYTITFVNADSTTCGVATYTSPHGFSIAIDAPPDAGTTAVTPDASADAAAPPVSSDAGTPMPYGTFTQVIAPGRDAFNVTCPSGESHYFNLNEVSGPPAPDGGDSSRCPEFEQIVPQASLQVYLGGVDRPGAVSFAIVYPPLGSGSPYPDGGPPLPPDRVVYFNCAIPAQAEICADGMKDGSETDVDCGGPQIPSQTQCGTCPPRCKMQQQCICDADCDETQNLVCAVNTMSGMRQCTTTTGATSSFPHCAWKPDAGFTCAPGTTAGTGGGGTGGGGTGGSGTGGGDGGTDGGDGG
jgi:hypothetical protein